MKANWTKTFVFLLVMAVILTACGQEETPAPSETAVETAAEAAPTIVAEETATYTPEPPEPTATDMPAPTETTAPTPTTEPTPTDEPVAEIADACLACHSDKDQLIDTAAPEEKVPSESSGVG